MIHSHRLISILSVVLFSLTLVAQQLQPYPVDTINGKAFYKYTVQKSEGLWRISKNFDVTQEELIQYNPEIEQGLKNGQMLLIPVVLPFDSSAYIVHEVQQKETLYSLSKRYGVRTQQIKDLNPAIKSSKLLAGQRILIAPKEKIAETIVEQTKKEDNKSEKQAEEKIEKKEETIKDAKREKNKDIEIDIKRSKEILKAADTILAAKADTIVKPIAVVVADSTDTAHVDSAKVEIIEPRQTPIRIACLLPLMSNQVKRHNDIERFVDFYEGILLAVNKAQKRGQRFEIYTYDTEKSAHKLEAILKEPALQNIDAIIGPAYPSQVSVISTFAFNNHIPALIPFTSHVSDIERNPYLLQFNANAQQEANALVDWMKQQTDSVNCVFVENQDEEVSSSVQYLKLTIIENHLPVKIVPAAAFDDNSIVESLKTDKQNIIIFQSDKFKAVEPYIPAIKSLTGKFNIRLLTQYSWQKETLNVPQIYTSVFNKSKLIDFSLMEYMQQYRRYFGHELSGNLPRYDLLGYDLATFLIHMLQQNGELNLQEKIEKTEINGLQSEIVMRKVAINGGYQNQGVQVMVK